MNNIVFIADFFVEEISGGGELNNEELFQTLTSLGREAIKVKSQDLTVDFIRSLGKKANIKYIICLQIALIYLMKNFN